MFNLWPWKQHNHDLLKLVNKLVQCDNLNYEENYIKWPQFTKTSKLIIQYSHNLLKLMNELAVSQIY